MPEDVCADAARHDRGRPSPGQAHGSVQAGNIGATMQPGACDRQTLRQQLLEVDPAAIERHQADVETSPVERRDQERPLALGASGVQVPAHEYNPWAPVARHRRPASASLWW